MKTVHSEERAKRLLAGLTQTQAGNLVGMTGAMLSMMERGLRKTKPEIRRRLLAVYEIKT